ncbi:DUF1302 domain-containing protein [Rivibacter subsaxonicus]|uniref:Uncharacterized protein DUF1302 n=1 Tax=Rivibacter subsaxonicus TaxID=457575 RepID=A0A4Q7W1K8_9BURK|nr:DUF1302 domain-containing protein [Rivibacter subsaxonicus]RZU02409.1 uncharacterized protein DUF1302 [Rivibacter subsaxonicus]
MRHPRPCVVPSRAGTSPLRITAVATAALAALLATGGAQAFEIDTGNPDIAIRWDNTVRANLAARVENRDDKIGNTPAADEGTWLFDQGDMVAKRLDLLSELDVIYKKRYGARISGAGWFDAAYGSNGRSNPNPPLSQIPSYINNVFSSTTKRLYRGASGELLDAFVFGGVDLGDVPVNAKAGRHTIYWGESVYLGGHLHSVSYAQSPLDLQKGFATPGTEVKELFRPLNQLSAQAQITDTLSLAGQYLLEWEPARFPEGGTYLGPVDFAFNGPDRFLVANLPNNPALGPLAGQGVGFTRGNAAEPKQRGEWGLAARWTPELLDGGTAGLYYRDFADKLPQALATKVTLSPALPGVGRVPLASGSEYNMIYADRIQLLGASIAKNIGSVSASAEISYRKNMPLNSQILGVAPGLPEQGETKGPRGNTWHGLVNMLGAIAKTPLFDAATFGAELQWMHLDKVTSGETLFNGVGYAPCAAVGTAPAKGKWDGCATSSYVGTSLAFTPTWFQVLPGVDLSAPMSYAVGLKGNAAVTFGGNQGLGNYTLGLSADVQQKYRFDLKYVDFVGHYKDNGTSVTAVNGFTTYLVDRGFVSLTFKTTF